MLFHRCIIIIPFLCTNFCTSITHEYYVRFDIQNVDSLGKEKRLQVLALLSFQGKESIISKFLSFMPCQAKYFT